MFQGVPAPYNLPVPPYHFPNDKTVRVGQNPPGANFDFNSILQVYAELLERISVVTAAALTVQLSEFDKERLEALAEATGRSESLLAAEAVTEYLALQEWQVSAIEAGIVSLSTAKGDRPRRGPQLDRVLGHRRGA